MEVCLRRLEVRWPLYWRKWLFLGLYIRFTTFTVLFLEHWRLFCVEWRYGCQDTGEKVYMLAFKTGLQYLPFYF